MARKGVAASLATVVLLTALVVADATVMAAQDNLATDSQASLVASRELLLERISAGTVSMQALSQVQDYLSSNPADCATLSGYIDSISTTAQASGEDSGISFATTARVANLGATPSTLDDNLTVVSPFSGYRTGALNLQAVISVKEVGGGGLVSLEKLETHVLNLPISPGSASSLCGYTLGALGGALSRSPCNSTLEREAFDSALPALVTVAESEGFVFGAGFGQSGADCAVSFWITLVEAGVAGVAGSFDWAVRGSGSA